MHSKKDASASQQNTSLQHLLHQQMAGKPDAA